MFDRDKPSLAAEAFFALLLAAIVLWYVWDAASASMKLGNLILIAPASLLAFGALASAIGGVLRHDTVSSDVAMEGGSAPSKRRSEPLSIAVSIYAAVRYKPIIYLALFVLYIVSMEAITFDLATFMFIASTMVVSRRCGWIEMMAVSAIGAAVITYGFKALIPYYEFPTILF